MNIMPWITVLLNCALTGIMTWLVKQATGAIDAQRKAVREAEEHRQKESAAMRNAMLAILRDRLFAVCMASLNSGEISIADKENVDSLYEQYHVLGGNHIGDTLYQRVENLRIIEE